MTKRIQTRQQREVYNLLLLFLTGYSVGLLPFMDSNVEFVDADTAADLALKTVDNKFNGLKGRLERIVNGKYKNNNPVNQSTG